MRLTSTVATGLLALGTLTACGGSTTDTATVPLNASPPPPTATRSPSASPDAAATSAAGDPDAIATAYPEIGLVFENVPSVTGAEEVALKIWTEFDAAVQRSNVTLTFDPDVARLGTAEMVQGIHNNIAYLKQHRQRYAGTTRERLTRTTAQPASRSPTPGACGR